MIIRSPNVWQPVGPIQLDQSNALNRSAVVSTVPGAFPFNLVDNAPLSIVSGADVRQTIAGTGAYSNGSSSYRLAQFPSVAMTRWTVFAVVKADGNATDTRVVGIGSTSSNNQIIQIGADTATATKIRQWCRSDNFTAATSVASTQTPLDGDIHTAAMLVRDDGYLYTYVNGRVDITPADWGNLTFTVNRCGLGCLFRASASNYWKGWLLQAAFWSRGLSDDEIQELHDNPWQLYMPVSRRLYFEASVAAANVFNPFTGRGGGAAQPLVQMRA